MLSVQGSIFTESDATYRGKLNLANDLSCGTSAFVGTNIKSFGKLVLVKHDAGIITAYAHLGDISVKEGEIVTAGQSIGTIGKSGRVDSPQLHFEIRKSRQPVDPRSLIS